MDDAKFIAGLMKENYEAVGFIPFEGIKRYIHNGNYLVIPQKGYLLHGTGSVYKPLVITQACIEFDFRDKGYGRSLVDHLIKRGMASYSSGVRLRCADTLDANLFWNALGFQCIKVLHPNNVRNRAINVWWLQLIPTLFSNME